MYMTEIRCLFIAPAMVRQIKIYCHPSIRDHSLISFTDIDLHITSAFDCLLKSVNFQNFLLQKLSHQLTIFLPSIMTRSQSDFPLMTFYN
jgi:hypothetical protein